MDGLHHIELSSAWLPPDPDAGRDAWLRRFGSPTGVAVGDRVWLRIEAAVECEVRLDGDRLPDTTAGGCWRYELTGRLRPRHELALAPRPVIVALRPVATHGRMSLPAPLGRVFLEIASAGLAATVPAGASLTPRRDGR